MRTTLLVVLLAAAVTFSSTGSTMYALTLYYAVIFVDVLSDFYARITCTNETFHVFIRRVRTDQQFQDNASSLAYHQADQAFVLVFSFLNASKQSLTDL